MKLASAAPLVGLLLAAALAPACKDGVDHGKNDLATSADLSASADLQPSYVGNQCGAAVCGTGDICCGDNAGFACTTSCDKTYNFTCDGPEDCGGGAVCCLVIDDPGTASNHFAGSCRNLGECSPTLSPAANPIVTASCHANADCASYHIILSKCCYNAERPSLTFCAVPFSNDGGINVICMD